MDALVVVNKPKGLTSRDVVNELNHIFATKKIGHTGTLDPLATGVLVCLIGRYTKLVNLITSYDKEYIFEIKLGIKTDTGDSTGNIIATDTNEVSASKLKEVVSSFPKEYDQEVPIYSAVKINGKKLYEYARENKTITLPKRHVHIYSLELLEYNNHLVTCKCIVSKGTYIRSLIQDICANLNTLGTLTTFVPTTQAQFHLRDSYTLEDIKNGEFKLLNIKEFLDYPTVELDDNLINKVINGNTIPNTYNIKDKVIFTYQNKDIAIYEVNEKYLKPYIML